jgi:hypothetical protein
MPGTRRVPPVLISATLHAIAATLLAGVVVLAAPSEEEVVIVIAPPRVPIAQVEPARDLTPNCRVLDLQKSLEDPVYRKSAAEDDYNEASDDDAYQHAKGEPLDFISDKPFKGRALYDVIGGSGGSGGRYVSRLGSRRSLIARG